MPTIFIDFRPAEYHAGKESYVSYYVINPETKVLARKRIKLNHIVGNRERERFARKLCMEINSKLYKGWNPFFDEQLRPSEISLEEAIGRFMESKRKSLRPASVATYESYIRIFNGWIDLYGKNKPVRSFTRDDADALFRYFLSDHNCGKKGYNNFVGFCKLMFNYFMRCEYITKNSFSHINCKREDEKVRDVIPPVDRKQIANYFVQNGLTPYLYVMQLCYRCFIRPKEILMLKIGDINVKDRMITIRSDVAKNHNRRTVGVPDEIMEYLLPISRMDPKLYIFSKGFVPGKQLLSSNNISRTWKKMRDELKLPASYQFYSLKDTGITEMLEAGVPAKYVKELADHHSLEMTERYTHKSEAKKILEWNNLEF